MKEINIKNTDFTLWEIKFEFSIYYNSDEFSFEEAKKDFFKKLGTNAQEEKEDMLFEEIFLSTEIVYYACDSGHGSNIITDCINALKEDSPGYNHSEYQYTWNKLDYNDYIDSDEIKWALHLSSNNQISYSKGVLSGDCLLLVWDDCSCDQCENEI